MAWSALAAGGNYKVHGHVTADNSSKEGIWRVGKGTNISSSK